MERHRIAVLDATGAAERGLIRALLDDPFQRFAVRALLSGGELDAAQALVRAGAEVRVADPEDTASLVRAFAGAYGVYASAGSGAALARARNLAFAADAADVRHVVWSTPAPDGVTAVFGERRLAATVLHTACEWGRLVAAALRRGRRGELSLHLPTGAHGIAGIAAEDIGACACGVFALGRITEVDSVVGRTIGIAAESLTAAELARVLGNVLDERVRNAPAESRSVLGAGDRRAAETRDALGADACVAARALHAGLIGFTAWAAMSADRIADGVRPSAAAAAAA